jgi:hypothetical protein
VTWYWNGEDSAEEIQRRAEAICKHHKIAEADLGGRLIVSDLSTDSITLASRINDGSTVLHTDVLDDIRETIRVHKIDAVLFDPFISTHRVSENDTGGIDLVAKALARIGIEMRCAMGLAHHARKTMNGGSGEVTMADSRGAIALIDAARIGRVLNFMSTEEAERCGVPPEERRRYVRIDDGKANLAPRADQARWVHLVSVDLGNATDERPSDYVGVPAAWEMPGLLDNVRADHVDEVVKRARRAVADGQPYRQDVQTANWIGREIADVLDLDLYGSGVKANVKKILRTWIENKALRIERLPVGNGRDRHPRPCIVPGDWSSPDV